MTSMGRVGALTFLLAVLYCQSVHSVFRHDSHNQEQSYIDEQVDGKEDPILSGEPRARDGEDYMSEFERIKEVLRDIEDERLQSRKASPLPGTGPSSLVVQTRATFLNLLDLYLPDPNSTNPQCRRDLLALYNAILNLPQLFSTGTLWPLKLVDSWGKFTNGMLIGNLKELGFFHECLDIRAKNINISIGLPTLTPSSSELQKNEYNIIFNHILRNPAAFSEIEAMESEAVYEDLDVLDDDEVDFAGQYCLLTYTSKPKEGAETSARHPSLRMPGLLVSVPALLPLMMYGTCMPSSCTEQELRSTVDSALKDHGLQAATVDCQTKDQQHIFNTPEIVGIVLFSLLGLILVLASLADIITSKRWQHCRTGPLKYLLTFSVPQNLTKLFHLDMTPSSQVISPIYGIRFLSIVWIVFCHQVAFSVVLTQNLLEIPKITQPVLFQVIGNADKSVDTFFLLSGLLVTIGLLTQLSRTDKFNPLLYYVHRIIRLVPPLALTVAFVATISSLLVWGPLAPLYEPLSLKDCRHNWWMDILLITNLILPHMQQLPEGYGGNTCISHTWYVDVDTQLYIFMPLVLLPLYYWPKKGRIWLALVTLASVATPAIITGVYHLWPTSLITLTDPNGNMEFNYKIYLMPWSRAGAYLVGAWYGYIIYLARKHPAITRLKMWQVWVGWGASTGIALAVLLGIAPYNYSNLTDPAPIMPEALAVLYGGLNRASWAVAVGWVLLACHWGYGGPVDWFLSHPIWQPFSRLTYCIYLTSLPIQALFLMSLQRMTYYSIFTKVQETCMVLLVVCLVSILFTLISEAPILRLEKLLLSHKAPVRRRSETTEEESIPATGQGQAPLETPQTSPGQVEVKIEHGEGSRVKGEDEVSVGSEDSDELPSKENEGFNN